MSRMIKPSSMAFFREGRRIPGYTLFDWLHGYVYGRWPYLYIGITKGDYRLSRAIWPIVDFLARLFLPRATTRGGWNPQVTFADNYHGKVVRLDAARQLINIHEEIRLTNLETVIPYARARDIIMKNPEHIVVMDCPCRSGKPNACLPLDVCLIIGDPFASFVEEHHARRSRRITYQEAEQIIRAEHQRGHVQHAFFKDAMLGRFYAICSCCECCCGAMQAHRSGTPMLASSGYVSRVNQDLCIGCGNCVETCPFGALSLQDGFAAVNEQACMGCEVCAAQCDQGALWLERASAKGQPLELQELLS